MENVYAESKLDEEKSHDGDIKNSENDELNEIDVSDKWAKNDVNWGREEHTGTTEEPPLIANPEISPKADHVSLYNKDEAAVNINSK